MSLAPRALPVCLSWLLVVSAASNGACYWKLRQARADLAHAQELEPLRQAESVLLDVALTRLLECEARADDAAPAPPPPHSAERPPGPTVVPWRPIEEPRGTPCGTFALDPCPPEDRR